MQQGVNKNDRNFIDFYIDVGTNFGMILEAKTDLKSDRKSIEFSTDFLYDFLMIFGALWRSPKVNKGSSKTMFFWDPVLSLKK